MQYDLIRYGEPYFSFDGFEVEDDIGDLLASIEEWAIDDEWSDRIMNHLALHNIEKKAVRIIADRYGDEKEDEYHPVEIMASYTLAREGDKLVIKSIDTWR